MAGFNPFVALATGALQGRANNLNQQQEDMREKEKWIMSTIQEMAPRVEQAKQQASIYNSRLDEANQVLGKDAPQALVQMYAENDKMSPEALSQAATNIKVSGRLNAQSTKASQSPTPTGNAGLNPAFVPATADQPQQQGQDQDQSYAPTAGRQNSVSSLANSVTGVNSPQPAAAVNTQGTQAFNGPPTNMASPGPAGVTGAPTTTAGTGGTPSARTLPGQSQPQQASVGPLGGNQATTASPTSGLTEPLNPDAKMSFTDRLFGRIPNDVRNQIIFQRLGNVMGKSPQDVQNLFNSEISGDYGFRRPAPASDGQSIAGAFQPSTMEMAGKAQELVGHLQYATSDAREKAFMLASDGLKNNDPSKIALAEGMAMNEKQLLDMRQQEAMYGAKLSKRPGAADVQKSATTSAVSNLGGAISYSPTGEMNFNWTTAGNTSMSSVYGMLANKSAQDGQRMVINKYKDANAVPDLGIVSRSTALALVANVDRYISDPKIAEDVKTDLVNKNSAIVRQYGFSKQQVEAAVDEITNPVEEAPGALNRAQLKNR